MKYIRLQDLNWKINIHKATAGEKMEYIQLLADAGIITPQQLDSYRVGINADNILKYAMLLGGIELCTTAIENILNK